MHGNVEDVGPHERFASGDDQEAALVDLCDLINEAETFLGRQFIIASRCLGGGVEVAMVALQIAAFRQVECDKVRLEVVNSAAVVRPVVLRPGSKKMRDLFSKRPERSGQRGYVENRQRLSHQ